MHMRKDHGRFLFSMFGPERPYKCNKCERSLDKDPSQDTHTCLPSYVPSRKGNHVTEDDLKCHQCNKVYMHTVPGHKSLSAGSFLKQNYPKYRLWILPLVK